MGYSVFELNSHRFFEDDKEVRKSCADIRVKDMNNICTLYQVSKNLCIKNLHLLNN